ncbi:6,7-dimethyl-8-ribityllumazine synthase [Nesterenkonia sp. F]|uniref:6,7-dimethyl-8-ribityllumazine synthase n=1 Tax=Nesterenkonia sp. F TaxID=795955 RepID=UPI000255CD4B|nr:6,7-dimethyl-8-ribityllumazine synthase [Nesterenkonia sp. F]
MSSTGTPEIDADELQQLRARAGRGLRVAVVASRWHARVMDGLIGGAHRFLEQIGVDDVTLLRAPGSFELPLIAARAAETHDAVVALGVVVRGGTPHFDYVCQAATDGLTEASLRTSTPMGFGVLTVDDDQQALDRAGLEGSTEDKGFEAAHAAVATRAVLDALD